MRALALVLLLAACTPATAKPPTRCSSTFPASPPPSYVMANQGEPVTLTLFLALNCDEAYPATVAVGAHDSDSVAVPIDSAEVVKTRDELRANITFTPPKSGLVHVVARFQPNLGLAQGDVLVSEDRRDAGTFPVAPALNTCKHLQRTAGGLTLCVSSSGVDVFSGDTRVQKISASRAVVAGDVVWTSQLERWVERNGAYVREPDVRLDVGLSAPTLLPASDDVLLYDTNEPLRRVAVDGGGFTVTTHGAFSQNVFSSDIYRDGDTVIAATLSADEGCTGQDAGLTLCFAKVRPDHIEPAGIWTVDEALGTTTLRITRRDGPRELVLPNELSDVTELSLAEWDDGLFVAPRNGVDPQEYGVSYRAGRIVLERYWGPGRRLLGATSGWAAYSDDGGVRLVSRGR